MNCVNSITRILTAEGVFNQTVPVQGIFQWHYDPEEKGIVSPPRGLGTSSRICRRTKYTKGKRTPEVHTMEDVVLGPR